MVASEDNPNLTVIEGGKGSEEETAQEQEQSLVDILDGIEAEDAKQQGIERSEGVHKLSSLTTDLITGAEKVKKVINKLREDSRKKFLAAISEKEESVKQESRELFKDPKAKIEYINLLLEEVEQCEDFSDLDRVVMKGIKTGLLEADINDKGFVLFKSVRFINDKRFSVGRALKKLKDKIHEKFVELQPVQKEKNIRNSKKGKFTNNAKLKRGQNGKKKKKKPEAKKDKEPGDEDKEPTDEEKASEKDKETEK